MNKIISWIFTAILTICLGALAIYYKNEMALKDVEIQSLKAASEKNLAETTAKLKAADERVAKTNASAAERIAVADAAGKEVEALASVKMKETSDQANAKMEAVENEARNKLQAANLPEATVEVSFRKALISNGSVAIIRNRSQISTPLTIVVARPTTNQSRTFTRVVDGARMTEIGEREGWAFLPGDVVRVIQPEHKPQDFNIK